MIRLYYFLKVCLTAIPVIGKFICKNTKEKKNKPLEPLNNKIFIQQSMNTLKIIKIINQLQKQISWPQRKNLCKLNKLNDNPIIITITFKIEINKFKIFAAQVLSLRLSIIKSKSFKLKPTPQNYQSYGNKQPFYLSKDYPI